MIEKPTVLYTREQIATRVAELGAEITRTFQGTEVCVVGLMKSCLVFMADVMRHVELDMTCHFLRASSFREEGEGSVRTDIVYSTEIPYEDRHILLLDDIVDTGITLNFLLDHIKERNPRALKVCTLIDKPGVRKIDVHPDWAAFTLNPAPDGFLVGYGLDYMEHYRGLPYIGTIPRTEPAPEGRKITPGEPS